MVQMVQMVVRAVHKGCGVCVCVCVGGGGFASLASFLSSLYISEFHIILLSLIPQISPLARK